jgi:CBS-domain-containing membrane protein
MKKLPIILLFVLTSCSHIGMASLSSNIVSVAATGKTNADHAISLLTQKDCKILRVIDDDKICH